MLIRADFVHFPQLKNVEILHDHVLAVDETGYISHFSPASSEESQTLLSQDADVTVIPRGSFVLPTFCDLHLHAPQFLYQGTGLHLPLMEWLSGYAFKAEERLDADPELAKRVYERLAENLVANGTGAVLLFGTIGVDTNIILAKAMQDVGIRAFVGKVSMDISSRPTYKEHTASAALATAEAFVDRANALRAPLEPHRRLVEPVLTPRFVPACSDALLNGLGELATRTGARIQSHLAEARDEVDLVKADRGVDDFEVFDRSKLLTPLTIQAHCTFSSKEDLAGLAARGTAIAHCPLSNAYFSAKPLPLREALDRNVRVGLGTDVAGGYSIDIMVAMRWAVGVSRMREGGRSEALKHEVQDSTKGADTRSVDIDWREAMFLATRGGAAALGLSSGAFVVGTPFDAQRIYLFDPESLPRGAGALDFFDLGLGGEAQDLSTEMIEKWWCLGDERNRTGMWVQGHKVGPWR
ncbi:Metallo-dependent hydrolase [Artomyces pyxidatus]|uniref:Metallo-dependent hydrolase n=1 Tax=Artomyces pyxidatus TaxID=48021 RepID=A0ACB8T001_9AGAM|nr:Metallo-dependent hydrolase [Artomyces pyxidatus]